MLDSVVRKYKNLSLAHKIFLPIFSAFIFILILESGYSLYLREWSPADFVKRAVFVVGSVVYMAFVTRIVIKVTVVQRISHMVEAAGAITKGDLNQTVVIEPMDELGHLAKVINNMSDQVERRLERAEQLSCLDGLTGLFNHRYFQQTMSARLGPTGNLKCLSLLFIDIDNFKHYNDTFGHQKGDQVLVEMADIFRKNIPPEAILARYGGEEFAIALPDVCICKAKEIAEKIRKQTEEYRFFGCNDLPNHCLTISIGVAAYPEHTNNKSDLIKLADMALYRAKQTGKNRVEISYSVLDELRDTVSGDELRLISNVKPMITLINAKDHYTYNHTEKVIQFSSIIGKEMNLSDHNLKILKYGSFLHDIGKIEVPAEILNKTEPLSKEEWAILKNHPAAGKDIISPIDTLAETIPIIYYHHERFDGSGYPVGLKGAEIPLLARIVTVADAFSAMLSERLDRNRRNPRTAITELKSAAGSQFDPDIVRSLEKALYTWRNTEIPVSQPSSRGQEADRSKA
ncbi:MAG: diguanylate cyclase [Eubacteriales bacterium]